MKIKKNPRT